MPQPASGQGRVPPGHGGLGRRRGRRRGRRALPGLGRGRDDGADLADGRPRPAQHRPQADLRRPELADLAGDRLAARRARAPLARPSACSTSRATGPSRVGPYEANLENARKIRDDWQAGRADPGATGACSRRSARPAPRPPRPRPPRCSNQGVAPGSLWDAVVLSGSELHDAQPRHRRPSTPRPRRTRCTTSSTPAATTSTRRLALLQAVGWQPLYRDRAQARASPSRSTPSKHDEPVAHGDEAVGEIFATINEDRGQAAAKTLGYLDGGGSADTSSTPPAG